MPSTGPNSHHYAIDAARLVEKCRSLLHAILDDVEAESSPRAFRRRSLQLAALGDALKCVDRLIHTHLLDLLDREMEFLSSINENDLQKKAQLHQFFGEHTEFPALMDTVKTLRSVERVAREYRLDSRDIATAGFDGTAHRRSHSTPPSVLQAAILSIDDPIEDEHSEVEGWYFGGGGRRSPSPPPLQSAGESSPPGTHRRAMSAAGVAGFPAFPAASDPSSPMKHSRSNKYCPSKSEKDSSLFRLIVTLQLCLVRIEEANSILCKGKARATTTCVERLRSGSFNADSTVYGRKDSYDVLDVSVSEDSEASQAPLEPERGQSKRASKALAVTGVVVGGALLVSSQSKRDRLEQVKLLQNASKIAAGVATASFVRNRWRTLCMNARVANSADALEDWIFGWICLGNNDQSGYKQHLVPRKSMVWFSVGSIRFQLMKRGMDLLYASIGKAIELTRGQDANETAVTSCKSPSSLWTYVVASLAASYYNVIGPAAKSASSLASAPSSVIQNAWGMVSLPAVKTASLEATRILKGAAIAERIEICGVSCFVLSREPFPALASALRRFRRQQQREDVRLGTIHESLSAHPSSVNVKGFQKRNVILHLTGGGFFAHTIAGDLPYLLDWSASTKAVVVIPEYALFPHRFPDAITQIAQIYEALRSGHAATQLGFLADRIIVSGESVGGNLAAALCVSLLTDHNDSQCAELTPWRSAELVKDATADGEGDESVTHLRPAGEFSTENRNAGLGLPDALMLCCPALNLSLDQTPSRVDGADDPVLPSALISTISNSYLGGFPETHPVASPFFATDEVLRSFPPTFIFTSSEDPLLDDSVAFNSRLRGVGVKSSLLAVHDLPHAYWGLATAGIPEARQVQKECQKWLAKIFGT
ncbi:hypothetical protein ACHAXT_012227 [Thalassiosira profunda]